MGRLALTGGSGLLGSGFPAEAERRDVETGRGSVAVLDAGEFVFLQRHGLDAYVAPHAMDHGANMLALAELDCDRVLAIGSVGSLKRGAGPGSVVCPDDFIALHLGISLDDSAAGHRVPGFDAAWRGRVVEAWPDGGPSLSDGGVYWQAIGPRLETPAEIRLIAQHADVIGMTLASECVLAGELGIAYAALCVVDNFANGIAEEPLTISELEAGRESSRAAILAVLEAAIPELAR